jgi:hypothetical protein
VLSAPHVIDYTYRRSVGPVLGAFFTALRERRIVGVRLPDGRVMVPPREYDPATGQALEEIVPVGSAGTVTTWSWVARPRPQQPLSHPFAYALVQLDGADTALLHAVDAGDASCMRTGMRVRARWRDETEGSIRDIACFEPEQAAEGGAQRAAGERSRIGPAAEGGAQRGEAERSQIGTAERSPIGTAERSPIGTSDEATSEPVRSILTPVHLEYTYSAGEAATRFLHGLARKKILGQRCPATGKVYVPPRGASPTHGVPTEGEIELSHRGTVTTFCIVRIPAENLSVKPPFAAAHIVLDGADIPFFHVISECPLDEIRMGMRVEAVWVPDAELAPTLRSIRWFRPTGEKDAPYESFRAHL